MTATGLAPDSLYGLSAAERRTVAYWLSDKAGDNKGREWWPQAIRRLSMVDRLALAQRSDLDMYWVERERRRVTASVVYFTEFYGHLQGPTGEPVPFIFWPESDSPYCIGARSQQEFLSLLSQHRRIICLKARQIGITWIVLHFSIHLMGFEPTTPHARVLAMSKTEPDAVKLRQRADRINSLLPPFLRKEPTTETARSLTKLDFVDGGSLVSLPGTENAARSESATFAFLDEFAFYSNGRAQPTWTAVLPTLGEDGRAVVAFTGNGPADIPGDGQAAARLWERAREGAENLYPVFLPSTIDPRRTEEWRKGASKDYLSLEDFEAEHPETEEQALQGTPGIKVFPVGISDAVRLGTMFDLELEAGTIAPPENNYVDQGIDWGDQGTHAIIVWPVPGGGLYIPPGEVVGTHGDAVADTERMLGAVAALPEWEGRRTGGVLAHMLRASYDSAGRYAMNTYTKIVRMRNPRVRTVAVPFNQYKRKTIKHIKYLLRQTSDNNTTQFLAISPKNVELIRQMRGYEYPDEESDEPIKGDDHGVDALIAGVAHYAARWKPHA